MPRFRHIVGALGVGALGVVALTGALAAAQTPPAGGGQRGGAAAVPEPKNLQVLPKTMTGAQVIGVMRNFTTALGTNCGYCHVWTGTGLPTNDYASDAKPAKAVARVMMQMANAANEQIAAGIKSKPASEIQRVQCMTCHRGAAIPVLPPPPAAPGAAPAAPPAEPGR